MWRPFSFFDLLVKALNVLNASSGLEHGAHFCTEKPILLDIARP